MKIKNKVELEKKDTDSFKKRIVEYLEYVIERKQADNTYTKYIVEKLRLIEVDEEFGKDIVDCSNELAECLSKSILASEKLAESIDRIYKADIQRDIKIGKILNINKLDPS